MTLSLKNWATAVFSVLALTVTLGLTAAVDSAEARPAYLKLEGVEGEASKPAKPGRTLKRADGNVCCSVPRRGKLALVKPAECRAVKGRVVQKTKCARVKRTSARKFSNIVLKRGVMRSSKPATPGSLTTGGAKGWNCANGGYYPCWCEGAGSCNHFIAACVEVGGDLGCTEHNAQGQPTACACNK